MQVLYGLVPPSPTYGVPGLLQVFLFFRRSVLCMNDCFGPGVQAIYVVAYFRKHQIDAERNSM